MVTLYWDEKSKRLAGSTRLNRYLKNVGHEFEKGQQVDVLITEKTRLGVNVVINKRFLGLVYHNEFFTKAKYGETTKGFIKEIRENNKIDVGLQKEGYAAVHDGADVLLTALENNRGFVPLTDKSDPETIKSQLGISKKVFKKALGQLYRQRIVEIKDDGIHLTAGD